MSFDDVAGYILTGMLTMPKLTTPFQMDRAAICQGYNTLRVLSTDCLVWKGKVATLDGNLWEFNFAKVRIVDVSDDYRFMQPPMPSDFYPVLEELWMPAHDLDRLLARDDLHPGYLYDWHEGPHGGYGEWIVGVVNAQLARDLMHG